MIKIGRKYITIEVEVWQLRLGIFLLLLGIFLAMPSFGEPELISPIPSFAHYELSSTSKLTPTPSPIHVPRWAKNMKLIVDEFSELGMRRTYEALQIAYCESHFNEKAINHQSGDYGLFQINTKIHNVSVKQALNPVENIRWTKAKVAKEGWQEWVCSRSLLNYGKN